MIIKNDSSEKLGNFYIEKSLQYLHKKNILWKFKTIISCWDFYYTSRTREIFRLEYSTDLRIVEFFRVKMAVDNIISQIEGDNNEEDHFQ